MFSHQLRAEADRAKKTIVDLDKPGKLNRLWGMTSGSAQFVMMAMFVQAFWFDRLGIEGLIAEIALSMMGAAIEVSFRSEERRMPVRRIGGLLE